MDKKSVILFASFLLILGVVFVMADLSSFSYLKTGDNVGIAGQTVGGVPTTVNLTITAAADGQNITNISIFIDPANYTTWDFVQLNGDKSVDEETVGTAANVSFNALGLAADWNCTNASTSFISCYNNTAGAELSAGTSTLGDNASLTILINVTGSSSTESVNINWTVITGSSGYDAEPGVGNSSEFFTVNDGLQPRLIELNITDGKGFTLRNGTNFTDYFMDSSSITVNAQIDDMNLTSPVYLYCSGNNTLDLNGEGLPSIIGGAQAITPVTVSGTSVLFSSAISSTCLAQEGNTTTFFLVANDSSNQLIQFNETTGELFAVRLNNTINPRVNFVNATHTYTDSESGTYTRTLTSTNDFGGGSYVGPKNITFTVEILGDQKNATGVYLVLNANASIGPMGNGQFQDANDTILMFNLSDFNSGVVDASTTGLAQVTWDLGSFSDNSTVDFYIVTNNTGDNYTTQAGPYRIGIDASAPDEPTMTPPADRTISPSGSIIYSCSSADGQSGLQKIKWKLTRPDSTTVTKAFAETSAGKHTITFTGTDTTPKGTYTVECTALDNVGNEIVHTSTSSQTFQVISSVVEYGGDAGSADGGTEETTTYDIDFSKDEEANLKAQQGIVKTFTFDGKTEHTITFSEVTETSAKITIASTPVEVTLVIGETKNVDVNGDGANDLAVKLNSITNNKADITVTKIQAGADKIVSQETTPVAPSGQPSTGEQQPPAEQVPPAEVEEGGSSAWIWIVILVVLAAAAAGYFLLRKKK